MTSAVPLLKSVRGSRWNFFECALELEICLGAFLPPPVAGKRRKKTVAGTRVKPSKCKLFQGEVRFLGFKVTGNTIKTDETKTACITSWEFPKNIAELRSLIGFLSYYRGFLKNFAARIEPLNEMLRKMYQLWPQNDG